ncbi:GIY-YIG nuclease family protein [Pseudomonas sp. EA_65y_Pfl1_P113]|uniref:GIY-YIG nuclease family protein n=1 Tax=Pseudomonas sp. EA_65y_Pfl1_P113 TaxID=3088692 RepID=UPI0030DB486C
MTIPLRTLFPDLNYKEHKIHFACWNQYSQPLDVFIRSRKEWQQWNSWRGKRDDFNRRYIFSLIDFYPEPKANTWLFGGVWEVLSSTNVPESTAYSVRLLEEYEHLIGKLKIEAPPIGRARRCLMEEYADGMCIVELFKEIYTGERFPGFDNLSLSYSAMETIFLTERLDWKTALENTKGVYLIADKKNGKKYIGAAYGKEGLWSRWQAYLLTGHGGHSDELTKLISTEGIEYAREYFSFTLLEYRSMRTDDEVVIRRESFWKEALHTRGAFGYNKN